MASEDRITYLVQPAQGIHSIGWEVRREGAKRASETDIVMTPDGSAQENAIEAAREIALYYWEDRSTPSQIKVREAETGEFRLEHTYGEDPERYEG